MRDNVASILGLGRLKTPLIRQSEAAECGLACLAMVAGFHGYKTDLPSLRRSYAISMKGMTLKSLTSIAHDMGFNSRALRGDIDNLDEVELPAVLHWDLSHFVVLAEIKHSVRGTRYTILDPAYGERIYKEAGLSKHFTGVLLELTPSQEFRPRVEKTRLRLSQLWTRISGLTPSLVQILVLSLALELIALAGPFYLQLALDTVLPAFDADLLLVLAFGFAGLTLIQLALSALRSWILLRLGAVLGYRIVVNLFRHLMKLPLPWFEKRHIGDIVSRFHSAQPITEMISDKLMSAVIDGVMVMVTLILMLVYSPLLTGLAVTALLLYICIRLAYVPLMKARNENLIIKQAEESSTFMESVRGMAAIKLFVREGDRQRMWQNRKAQSVNAQMRMGRLTIGFRVLHEGILGLEKILFVYFAVKAAMSGQFTVGMVFAFAAYKQQFMDAVSRLVDQAIDYRMLDIHLERIADIALAEPEPKDRPSAHRAKPLAGGIELRDVHFAYASTEPMVLQGINLMIAPGETVAIIGSSGGGKTTLMKIMLGLFEPTEGEVLVDGIALPVYGRHAFRRQVSAMMQEDVLYAGSIAENISFFEPDASMTAIVACAQAAMVHDEIMATPMEYESLVGDMGSTLSGGQKQRIILARALYAKPKILFMDEGTAHLDVTTEAAVNASIQRMGMTRIVIAHRPETVRAAGRVVALIDGRIVEISKQECEEMYRGKRSLAALTTVAQRN